MSNLNQHEKAVLKYLKDGEKKKHQIVNKMKRAFMEHQNQMVTILLLEMTDKKLIINPARDIFALPVKEEDAKVEVQKSLF